MKRLSFLLLALLTLCGVGNAQVSGLSIGYCSGQLGANPSGYTSTTKGDHVSAAIFVPADQVGVYAGNHIDEIKVGLASKLNIESLEVWLRSELDGENLASTTMESANLVKGWNTVALTEPFNITAETEGLYIGYTYTQKGTSKAIAIVEQPQANALWAKLGAEAEWADRSDEGTLSLEALVYGDNLPKYNLSLVSIGVQPVFVVDKGTLDITATLRNVASTTITGFDAVCQIEGYDETFTTHIDQVIAYNEQATVQFTISPTVITSNNPDHQTVVVTITNLAEGADEAMSDNTLQATFQVVNHDFTRVPLVEEFTTEKCSNCPRVAAYLHTAAEDERFAGRFNTVEHHSGYYTDLLTIHADTEWEWFYDNVYAPAILLDRAPEYGDASGTAIFNPTSQTAFNTYLQYELLKPAFVSLKIQVDPDEENNQLHIKVTGERSKADLTVNPARITVMLTETNLTTTNQAGYNGEYVHVNVGRRVNNTWGDIIEWDGDQYTYECTLANSGNYVQENLGVLAFIHDGDTSDKLAWEVCNSAAITAADFGNTSGISQHNISGGKLQYYQPNGAPAPTLRKGLNIVREPDGCVRKVMY